MCTPIPSRGVATADTLGDGRLDFAIARQYGPPAFYANESPNMGAYLGLNLYRPVAGGAPAGRAWKVSAAPPTAPRPDHHPKGTQISQLDGGSGSGGKRSFEVSFGLGSYHGPVTVHLQWHDTQGQLRQQTVTLSPGTHNLVLTNTAQEVPSR